MFFRKKQQALGEAVETALTAGAIEGRSPWRDARERFFRNKAAVVSLILYWTS